MEAKTEKTGHEDLEWGYGIPQSFVERIRENVPKIGGLDEENILKGHVFERILYDDIGAFGTAALWFSGGMMEPNEAKEHKKIFLNRLRWEAEQSQTPLVIKEAIEDFRGKLQGIEWDKEENVKAGRALWNETVRSKAQAMVDANQGGAKDALDQYYLYTDEVAKRKLSL